MTRRRLPGRPEGGWPALALLGPAAAVLAVQLAFYPVPLGVWIQGLVGGLLNALVVLGLLLIYRANRTVNLSQATLGTFPTAIAVGVFMLGAPGLGAALGLGVAAAVLVVASAALLLGLRGAALPVVGLITSITTVAAMYVADALGYWGALLLGLVLAAATGAVVDALVIARFRRAPRLVLTVATVGLAQLLAVTSVLAPRIWGRTIFAGDGLPDFRLPGDLRLEVGDTIITGDHLFAGGVAVLVLALTAWALSRSDAGVAVRAAADRADRASMLGIPVRRLECGVWVVAAVLGFLGTFLQAGMFGLGLTTGLGLRVMVAALAALAVTGFGSMPAAILAAVAVGILAESAGLASGNPISYTDAVLAAVVIVGLLARHRPRMRADRGQVSSWQASADPRSVPPELSRLRPVAIARWAAIALGVGLLMVVPAVSSASANQRLANIAALAILALSVVVVTGWTGEVTLGQMGFAAVGAAVAAVATQEWQFDLLLTLVVAGAVAAVVSMVVGLPSIRTPGLYLAVSTLAFTLAVTGYLLNPTQVDWIPTETVVRRPLLGVWAIDSRAALAWLCSVSLIVCLVLVSGVRKSRIGRTLRAVRDNGPAAQSFGVRLPVAKLTAFGFSGFLAGIAGALLLYVAGTYDAAFFSADRSLNVFISAVVGGVGSALGAVLGAAVLDGSRFFLTGPWALLPSALGVLVVLIVLPGGLADLVYRIRDRALRSLAASRGIEVPSLAADRSNHPTAFPGVPDPHPVGVYEPVVGTSDGQDLLSVRGLEVAYDGVDVLFGVDLDVAEGQITALLGTNGAGKSTLLRAIGGVAPVVGGSISLDGVELTDLAPEEIPRHGVAQMPGGQGLFPSLTVDENLRAASWLLRDDRSEADRRIAEARRRFPFIADRGSDEAGDLSGGQQQQLAVAMAFIAKPRLLLIDELSMGLAPVIVEQLLRELLALREEGTTIVVVEQSVNVALTIADHAYFMEKGEVRFSGSAADLLDQPDLLRSVYLQGARDAISGGSGPARGPTSSLAPNGFAGAAGGSAPVLELADLSVSFGGIMAVSYVDLTVTPGEVVGIIGPNGAGKTTLFDLVSGFTESSSGRVHLHGRDISALPPSARSRAGLGRSFQDARLFGGLTVAETIAVSLERWMQGGDVVSGALRLPASQLTEKAASDRVEELMDLFGLDEFRGKRLSELSTGSRRMVDLACVVAHAPSVILLDEPSGGIAQREAEALGPLLLGLRDRLGASLLIIEHDMALVASIADRLVAMDQGRVVATGSPAEVVEHRAVVDSYLGSGAETLQRSDHSLGGSR